MPSPRIMVGDSKVKQEFKDSVQRCQARQATSDRFLRGVWRESVVHCASALTYESILALPRHVSTLHADGPRNSAGEGRRKHGGTFYTAKQSAVQYFTVHMVAG